MVTYQLLSLDGSASSPELIHLFCVEFCFWKDRERKEILSLEYVLGEIMWVMDYVEIMFNASTDCYKKNEGCSKVDSNNMN